MEDKYFKTDDEIIDTLKSEHKEVITLWGCSTMEMNLGKIITLNRLARSLGLDIRFGGLTKSN